MMLFSGVLRLQFSESFQIMNNDRRKKYEEKRDIKRVSFNTETEADLLAIANALPNFSTWVKKKLAGEKKPLN